MAQIQTESLVREADILADCFEDVRSLLKFYLMHAKDVVDPYRAYEFDGKRLNTLYWLSAHLAWAEHFLLIEAMGGESLNIPWLAQFEIGSTPPDSTDLPTFDEVKETLGTVHARAMSTLRNMTSEDLDQPNAVGLSFRGGDSKRAVIRHAIRHEPFHIGQIGWLVKLGRGSVV